MSIIGKIVKIAQKNNAQIYDYNSLSPTSDHPLAVDNNTMDNWGHRHRPGWIQTVDLTATLNKARNLRKHETKTGRPLKVAIHSLDQWPVVFPQSDQHRHLL